MPIVNKPTRVNLIMLDTDYKPYYGFVFSSDIRDWMPKVQESRDKQKAYTSLKGYKKKRL